MRLPTIFFAVLIFCSCYSSKKKFDAYIGSTKHSLVLKEGPPLIIYTDSTGESVVYSKPIKIHNPKYSEVWRRTTFFLNPGGTIYKWKSEKVKTKPTTGKPSLAIEFKH